MIGEVGSLRLLTPRLRDSSLKFRVADDPGATRKVKPAPLKWIYAALTIAHVLGFWRI